MNIERYGLMIDLETLSLHSTAFVTQVGIALYDFHKNQSVLSAGYNVHAIGQENSHVSESTIAWWNTQSQDARNAVFGSTNNIVAATELLRILQLIDCEFQPLIWAGPAMFDLPILTNLLGSRAWNYSRERDFSTIRKLFDPNQTLRPEFIGEAHVAVDDALHQMQYLVALHQKYNVHR